MFGIRTLSPHEREEPVQTHRAIAADPRATEWQRKEALKNVGISKTSRIDPLVFHEARALRERGLTGKGVKVTVFEEESTHRDLVAEVVRHIAPGCELALKNEAEYLAGDDADIVNLSFSFSNNYIQYRFIRSLAEETSKLFVKAAGNTGYNELREHEMSECPENLIYCANVTADRSIHATSSYLSDIVASCTVSALGSDMEWDDGTRVLGTSFSAPVVCGIVALILESVRLPPTVLRECLLQTATRTFFAGGTWHCEDDETQMSMFHRFASSSMQLKFDVTNRQRYGLGIVDARAAMTMAAALQRGFSKKEAANVALSERVRLEATAVETIRSAVQQKPRSPCSLLPPDVARAELRAFLDKHVHHKTLPHPRSDAVRCLQSSGASVGQWCVDGSEEFRALKWYEHGDFIRDFERRLETLSQSDPPIPVVFPDAETLKDTLHSFTRIPSLTTEATLNLAENTFGVSAVLDCTFLGAHILEGVVARTGDRVGAAEWIVKNRALRSKLSAIIPEDVAWKLAEQDTPALETYPAEVVRLYQGRRVKADGVK